MGHRIRENTSVFPSGETCQTRNYAMSKAEKKSSNSEAILKVQDPD